MNKMLSELLLEYKALVGEKEFPNLRSILNVYILPELLERHNLQHLQNRKTDYIFDHIAIAGFIAIADPICQNQTDQLANPGTKKTAKSRWKRFCTWLQQHKQYIPDPAPLSPNIENETPSYTHIPKGTLKTVMGLKKRSAKPTPFRSLKGDLLPTVRDQIQSLKTFLITVSQWRKKSVALSTLDRLHESIGKILGYRRTVQDVALETLAITDLLDLSTLRDYEQWSRGRGISSNTIKTDFDVVPHIAKWQSYQKNPNENYNNSESVKKIHTYLKSVIDYGDRPQVSDEAYAKRALSRDQCWEILKYLRWRCLDLEKQHGRTSQVVIDAWQDYLIIAVLVTAGIRQGEIRDMRRQYLSIEGNVITVTLPPEGHKTGKTTGKGRAYPRVNSLYE